MHNDIILSNRIVNHEHTFYVGNVPNEPNHFMIAKPIIEGGIVKERLRDISKNDYELMKTSPKDFYEKYKSWIEVGD